MQTQIIKMINDFEHGRISRRQLITHLTWLVAVGTGASQVFAQPDAPKPPDGGATFHAVDLHHVALSVRDVQRSQKWYQQHLGLSPTGAEGFLTTGKGWLALSEATSPGCITTATASTITIPTMRSSALRPRGSRPSAAAVAFTSMIPMASNVRSHKRSIVRLERQRVGP